MKLIRDQILQEWLQSKDSTRKDIANMALSARVFNIQNVYNFTCQIFEQENGGEGLDIEGYVLKLPYPVTLFELESRILTEDGRGMTYAVVCGYSQDDQVMLAACVARSTLGTITPVIIFKFRLNEDGTPVEYTMSEAEAEKVLKKLGLDEVLKTKYLKPSQKEALRDSAFSMKIPHMDKMNKSEVKACMDAGMDCITPTLYALNLLNCKNVRRVEHTTHQGLTRKQQQKTAYQEYKTLDVPLINKISSGEIKLSDLVEGEKGKIPLHTVRGHCKTYTAEAPLLGQHVGRWFWGPQLRGTLKNGITQKEYRTVGELCQSDNAISK